MTPRLISKKADEERISLQDVAWAQYLFKKIIDGGLWTYAFNIASDTSHEGRNPNE